MDLDLSSIAVRLAERGLLPEAALRLGIRRLLRQRLDESHHHDHETAAAWLERFDAHRTALWPVFESVYGAAAAPMWWQRWRLFLLSVEELFGYDRGQQWWVSHYLFAPRR